MLQEQRQFEPVTVVELVVVDPDDGGAVETWRVTPTVYLRVSAHADERLVAAVVDAICAC